MPIGGNSIQMVTNMVSFYTIVSTHIHVKTFVSTPQITTYSKQGIAVLVSLVQVLPIAIRGEELSRCSLLAMAHVEHCVINYYSQK